MLITIDLTFVKKKNKGSGKTTLLDVLAGRQKAGKLTGTTKHTYEHVCVCEMLTLRICISILLISYVGRILVNGNPRDKFYKRLSGYVTQVFNICYVDVSICCILRAKREEERILTIVHKTIHKHRRTASMSD